MRLEHLFDFTGRYLDWRGGASFGGAQETWFARGEGKINGSRLSGTTIWAPYAERREDGCWITRSDGVITTDDGASVIWTNSALSVESEPYRIQTIGTWRFHADDPRYSWLNKVVALMEADGLEDPDDFRIKARIHRCVFEGSGLVI